MRLAVLYLLISLQVIAVLVTVATVGEERKPVSPLLATATVVTGALFIIGLLFVGEVI